MTAAAQASLDQALGLLNEVDNGMSSGRWSRAAAILLRHALEETISAHWTGTAACVDSFSGKAQLLCLPEYVAEEHRDLALSAHLVWESLSNATHVDAGYELSPTASELRGYAEVVAALVGVADGAAVSVGS